MGICCVVLSFVPAEEIPWCSHSNKNLFRSTFAWYHLFFNMLQNDLIFDFLALLRVKVHINRKLFLCSYKI